MPAVMRRALRDSTQPKEGDLISHQGLGGVSKLPLATEDRHDVVSRFSPFNLFVILLCPRPEGWKTRDLRGWDKESERGQQQYCILVYFWGGSFCSRRIGTVTNGLLSISE